MSYRNIMLRCMSFAFVLNFFVGMQGNPRVSAHHLTSEGRFNSWWELRQRPVFLEYPEELQDQIIDINMSEPDINEANARMASAVQAYVVKLEKKNQWDSWLKEESKRLPIETEKICCVCMEDETPELWMNYIPCFNSNKLHPSKICLDCLDKLVRDDKPCPICRASLEFNSGE